MIILSYNLKKSFQDIDAKRIEFMEYIQSINSIIFEDVNNKIILYCIDRKKLFSTGE